MGITHNMQFIIIIICVGDPDQCKAPVDNFVRYDKNPLFLSMCGNYVVTLKYKEGFSRYDRELYEVLISYNDKKTLVWECDEIESYINICYTNSTRHKLNERCFKRWVEENDSDVVSFGFPVCVGLPVMAYDDADKALGIFKTQVWKVEKIDKKEIVLSKDEKEVSLDKQSFRRIFPYAFCMTAHKCQGLTIREPYNIYEADLMSAEVLYTALSRGVKKEFVHIPRCRSQAYEEMKR